jgi:hypothetical protein
MPDRYPEKISRFERLAQRRMTEVLHKLRLIGNLANRNNYAYTDDHARQIIEALEAELRQVKAKFRQEASSGAAEFSFRK